MRATTAIAPASTACENAAITSSVTKQGVDLATAIACLGELPVTSPAAKAAGSLMLNGNHAPLFPIALVEKDFRYATQTAQSVAATMPLAIATHEVYQEAIAKGYGNSNITGIAQLFI